VHSWAHNFYDLLLHPSAAFARLSERHHWGLAACILGLGTLLHTFTQAGAQTQALVILLPQLFVNGMGVFLLWIAFSLLISLCADLFGGQGRITDTMTGLGLASLPLIFLAPVSALPNFLGQAGFTLQLLLTIAVGFWTIILLVLGIQSAQQFSLDKAIGSLVISGLTGFALSVASIITGLAQIVMSIQSFIS
jgi:hypothetical protein